MRFRHSFIVSFQQNVQGNSNRLENLIKRHEDNLKFLTTQTNQLDESILDLQGRKSSPLMFLISVQLQTLVYYILFCQENIGSCFVLLKLHGIKLQVYHCMSM